MASNSLKEKSLKYNTKGKIGTALLTPAETQEDLALAYSPGVAYPCLEIAENKDLAYTYTNKANVVGVISNGTAVLGLGNIGAAASKPVMEGKALLFKRFAGVDAFDIEIDETDIDSFCHIVKSLEPSFGGINLEDIKAPECFEIEQRLIAEMNIPIMHDDQHGTAIVTIAGLLNAFELTNRSWNATKVVINGAGASALSIARLLLHMGITCENLILLDSKGTINERRTDINKYKQHFISTTTTNTLEEAIAGADVFIGVSQPDLLTPQMLKSMAKKDPIVFAMANPNPEITYDLARETRKDVIIGTGRSDYPNQINNALVFPFIFRGALDTQASEINIEMKIAAAYALAQLAKQEVPQSVLDAYQLNTLSYNRDYLIPKPLDPRLIVAVSSAVAQASIHSNSARKPITDFNAYKQWLATLI